MHLMVDDLANFHFGRYACDRTAMAIFGGRLTDLKPDFIGK